MGIQSSKYSLVMLWVFIQLPIILRGVEEGIKAQKIPIIFIHDNSDVGMGDGGIAKW
jgi:hypothetical protein